MPTFLEAYEDQALARSVIEQIAPIKFAQIESRLWTTTGELDKWGVKGRPALRLRGQLPPIIFGHFHYRKIESADEAEDLATRMGKPKGCFGAALSMYGYIGIVSAPLSLFVVCCHNSDRGSKLRFKLGLPDVPGKAMERQLIAAIASEEPDPSWQRSPSSPQIIHVRPQEDLAETISREAGTGVLSRLMQQCLDAEKRAQADYDEALCLLREQEERLAKTKADTLAISRAIEVAERYG